MAIPIVGKVFRSVDPFLDYLEALKFSAWRPSYVTMHHCGAPDLKTWNGWQTRKPPISDEQWLQNLASYYGKSKAQGGPPDGPWRSGPHFMITPIGIGVLSPPTARGVHAVSFNANSWGVEIVGNFDTEAFAGPIRDMAIDAIAAMHVAMGWNPGSFKKQVSGLHFHRDDPKTNKTCPGKKIDKPSVVKLLQARMLALTPGAHVEEPKPKVTTSAQKGFANTDDLNVRTSASAKAPVARVLNKNQIVVISRSAMNGDTKWYEVGDNEWVAARFVTLEG